MGLCDTIKSFTQRAASLWNSVLLCGTLCNLKSITQRDTENHVPVDQSLRIAKSILWKVGKRTRRLGKTRGILMELNDLTREIIGGAIEVHKELGPGMLESA